MKKWKVLLSVPYLMPVMDKFQPIFDKHGIELVIPGAVECLNEEELLKIMPDIDAAICVDDHIKRRVLEAAPKLKVISKWGTGIDAIDLEAAKELGIIVRNTPDAFTRGVADTALGYMLNFARQLPALDRDMKAGEWKKHDAVALHELTVGIIGVGHIGKAVARRLKAFGPRIVGNDVQDIPRDFITETGMEVMSKEQVLKEADMVSLHCTLNNPHSTKKDANTGLIGKEELAMMKKTAVIINTARGQLILMDALVDALQSGGIAGAALDVFQFEPLPKDSPLRSMDNVLMGAHNANASTEARNRINKVTVDNCLKELAKFE